MIIKAKLRFTRISPKKAREVINLIRGKHIHEAQDILTNLNRRNSKIILGLLNSAISNAKQTDKETNDLYISKIIVNEGPFLKRHRAEAFGRASLIKRRLSHIEIELDRLVPKVKKTKISKQPQTTSSHGATRKKTKSKTKKKKTKVNKDRV